MSQFLHEVVKKREAQNRDPWITTRYADSTMDRQRNLERDYERLSLNVWIRRDAPRTPARVSGALSLYAQAVEYRRAECVRGLNHIWIYQGAISGYGVTQHRFACTNCLHEVREVVSGENEY